MPPSDTLFHGAVALELVAGAEPRSPQLEREAAARCAGQVANDLARLLPESSELDLALAAALFDPAELLRPGWPVHAALARLVARAPGAAGGRVLAFGARDGRMGDAGLEPDPALAGSPLRLLPWQLSGPPAAVAAAGAQLEELLLDRGMAEAATALALQDAFGVALEHVRLATLNDLLALTAMQYRHAALDGAWAVIEAALLTPADTVETRSDGPPLAWRDGLAWLGTLDEAAWRASGLAPAGDADSQSRAFRYWQMRERQLAAVLAAHGLTVQRVALPRLDAPLQA